MILGWCVFILMQHTTNSAAFCVFYCSAVSWLNTKWQLLQSLKWDNPRVYKAQICSICCDITLIVLKTILWGFTRIKAMENLESGHIKRVIHVKCCEVQVWESFEPGANCEMRWGKPRAVWSSSLFQLTHVHVKTCSLCKDNNRLSTDS